MSKDMLGISVHNAQGVVTDLLEKLGGPNGQEWLSASKRFLRKESPWPVENIYTLTVNYGLSVEEALSAGNYDWTGEYLTSQNFPPTRRGTDTIEARLVHFGHEMTSDEVLEELDKQGLRPAIIEELFALGAQHSYLQRQFPIVALSSVWTDRHGDRRVPGLWGNDRGRGANLYWFDDGWSSACRFLAVRK